MSLLADRSDYIQQVPAEIRIDGGILPNRDLDPSRYGNPQVLRGEDPAFLTEALYRRLRLCSDIDGLRALFGDGLVPVTKVIRGDRLSRVANFLSGAQGYTTLKDRFVQGPPTFTNISDRHIDRAAMRTTFGMVPVDTSDCLSDPSDFARGKPLALDPVRKLYHDLKKYRWTDYALYYKFSTGWFYLEELRRESGGTGRNTPGHTDSGGRQRFFCHYAYQSRDWDGDATYEGGTWRIPSSGLLGGLDGEHFPNQSGGYDFTQPVALVSDVRACMEVATVVTGPGHSSSSSSVTYYDIRPVNLIFDSNHTVLFANRSALDSVGNAILSDRGISLLTASQLPTPANDSSVQYTVEQVIVDMWGAFCLEDSTVIDSLNWIWPPAQ